jgi:hypothetical protein
MVDVRWRTAARHIVRFSHAEHTAGVAAVDANDQWNAEDVYLLAAVVGDKDGLHK